MQRTNRQHQIKAILLDRKGKVLSIGQNSYTKSHPLQAHYAEKVGEPYKIFIHAEIDAIVKCADLSRAHTLRIFRFNKDGKPAMAKPCSICQSAIEATNIQRVEYTKG